MTKNTEIDDLNSLIGLMIAAGETGSANENRIGETRRLLDKWHKKGHKLFMSQQVIKKRDKIILDAREVSLSNEKMWVWVAVDLNDEMVIAIHVSYVINMAATYSFLKNIARLCKGTLPKVFVNGETWDPVAFEKKTPKNIRRWIEGFAGFTNYWTAKR